MDLYGVKTPIISDHARLRCRQMRIGTKIAKWIVRHPTITRHTQGRVMVWSDEYPDYTVLYVEKGLARPVVVTVLWRDQEQYGDDDIPDSAVRRL